MSTSNSDFDDTDKIIQENIKSVGEVENTDAQNQNDKLYHDEVQSQLREDTQQTEFMVLKALADTEKEMTSKKHKKSEKKDKKDKNDKKKKDTNATPITKTQSNKAEKEQKKNQTKVQEAPKSHQSNATQSKADNKAKSADKPAPKVQKTQEAKPTKQEQPKPITKEEQPKPKQKAQGLVQQESESSTDNDEEVETSSEVLADDFDSDSKSIHSLAQRSRLADNMHDDADKYDFADNYQQTDEDVNADPKSIGDK